MKLITLVLIFVAAFCGSISKDHDSYTASYKLIASGINTHEITFVLICQFANNVFHNPAFLFLIYAILGVTLKIISIRKLTEFWFYSILIYFSYYFFLHELTQIRAGVSSAFILLSIPSIYEKNWKKFMFFAVGASLFHFSGLIIFPLYFLRAHKIELLFFFLIPIGFIMYFARINVSSLIKYIHIDIVSMKYSRYFSLREINKINVFNVLMLARYVFSYILLWKYKELREKNIYSILLIKLYIISSFVFLALGDIPGVAFRLSELLAIVEIILIPFIIYLFKIKEIGKISVAVVGFLILCLVLFYQKLVLPYF